MEKEKVMHILSVLLDELAKKIWHELVACWTLSGDDGESLVLELNVYEEYNVPLSRLKELIEKFEVPSCGISFRSKNGLLYILITLSNE